METAENTVSEIDPVQRGRWVVCHVSPRSVLYEHAPWPSGRNLSQFQRTSPLAAIGPGRGAPPTRTNFDHPASMLRASTVG